MSYEHTPKGPLASVHSRAHPRVRRYFVSSARLCGFSQTLTRMLTAPVMMWIRTTVS